MRFPEEYVFSIMDSLVSLKIIQIVHSLPFKFPCSKRLNISCMLMKSDKIKNWPVKERPRERLISEGAERVTNVELLAIVLRVGRGTFKKGVLGQNATDFAKELLTEFSTR